ncbi:response regulator [Paenibacillus sp. J5C_2022]|uniref:response regulator n=1 Tax=Paenibacillus sp. J5C2022 TaxID=2977129 RepID=UPI0021CF6E1F|nr:response regulator [Paenibacillus sp. J5C2022]MCU6711044.1 response regulator [Paenibacillus sp. J5C2022]
MGTYKIMIVDDDPHICEIVQVYCEREGFLSSCSHNGTEAMKLLASFEPDLIVLDVLLANENGIDWCMNARSYTNAPIVFLSSREEDEVKISALSYGGDASQSVDGQKGTTAGVTGSDTGFLRAVRQYEIFLVRHSRKRAYISESL